MSKGIEAKRSGPFQGLREAQALQASKCRGRVRKEPGRRDLVWKLGLGEFSLISTPLVALTTPWLVIFVLGPQTPIESGQLPTPIL